MSVSVLSCEFAIGTVLKYSESSCVLTYLANKPILTSLSDILYTDGYKQI